MSTYESTLNTWLADALSAYGLDATPESGQGGGRRLDIEIVERGIKIALEAEQGDTSNKKSLAIKDADQRIKQKLAYCAIAVCYEDGLRSAADLARSELQYTLRTISLQPQPAVTQWNVGNVASLVGFVRRVPDQLGDPDNIANILAASLTLAARRLSVSQKKDLVQSLDLLSSKGLSTNTGHAEGSRLNNAAQRALLVLATATMFHARLDSHRHEITPLWDHRYTPLRTFEGDWPPARATDCARHQDPIGAFDDAWDLWQAVDYKPIFATARSALSGCAQDAAFAEAVRGVAQASIFAVRSIAGLRHDLLGRIFHTVLDTARYDGSFYTSTTAATLLANLAILRDTCDWTDSAAISKLRITDPACGTGTLLMAAAERIRDLISSSLHDRVSQSLIENVLIGYDANLTATHLAATTLGLLSPTTTFKDMKIGRALLGVEDGKAYLGSLEFLSQEGLPQIQPWPSGVEQLETEQEVSEAELADLVIMNPPFTRDSLRYDQFPPEEEAMLKNREKEMFRLLEGGIHRSHSGGGFLVLAEHIAKPDSGTIAAVLPLSGATNYSTRLTRMYLASKFHIETIITSHDPTRTYFSENTDIGEMLLLCRRWQGPGDKPATRVYNLFENPATPAEAVSVAQDMVDGRRIKGSVQEWSQERIADGDWGAVQFLSPHLCETFHALRKGRLFKTRGLGTLAKIGPAGQGIRGVFDRTAVPDSDAMRALWFHKTHVTQKMLARADTYIKPKTGKSKQAGDLWAKRGKLMLVTRARLNTVRCISVRLNEAVLGSLWVPCKFNADIRDLHQKRMQEEVLEKATCVYLNSTVGVLAFLGDRTSKILSYPHFSMDDLNRIPVPEFTVMDKRPISILTAAYDSLVDSVLLPLRQAENCETRKALDDAVVAALDLDLESIASIRRELAREPSVTNRPYEVGLDTLDNDSPQLPLWT